jgi:hypothetical protein
MCLDRPSIDRLQKADYFSKRQIVPMRTVWQKSPLCAYRPFVVPIVVTQWRSPQMPESESLSLWTCCSLNLP